MIKKYSGFLYLLSTDMIIKGLNLVLVIYFARHLSIEDFGSLSLLLTYLTYFIVFIEFGTSHLALREIITFNITQKKEFITNIITFKLILSLISMVFFNILFFNHFSTDIMIVFSILLFLSSFISDWYFKALYRNNILFKAYFFSLIGYLYLIAVVNETIQEYFIIRILLVGISVAIMMYYVKKDFNINLNYISFHFIKYNIISKSYPLFISTVAVTIYYNSDVIMLNIYKGSYEVGIYSAYYKFVFIFLTFKAVVVGYITSKLSFLYIKKEYLKLKNMINTITKYILIFLVFMLLFIYSLNDIIIEHSFGNKYIVDGGSHLLLVLLTTVLITYSYLLFPTVQIISNNQKLFMYYTLTAAIINIFANMFFIPSYGFTGAAYSTLISETVMLVLFSLSYIKFIRGIV